MRKSKLTRASEEEFIEGATADRAEHKKSQGGRPPKFKDAVKRTIVLEKAIDDAFVKEAEEFAAGNVSAVMVKVLTQYVMAKKRGG